jgi:hypothetical protein
MFYSILSHPPYEIEVEEGDEGGFMTDVSIARDHTEQRVVSVVCQLIEANIAGQIHWEFSYWIAVFSLDDSTEPFETQDRNVAFPYIPSDVRPHVVPLVCECLKALVQRVRPALTYWVTKDRNPHEKVLPRYYILKETLENEGYSPCREGTDPYGRRFWTMERR